MTANLPRWEMPRRAELHTSDAGDSFDDGIAVLEQLRLDFGADAGGFRGPDVAIMVLGFYFLANRKSARASARPNRIRSAAGATYPLRDQPPRNTHEPHEQSCSFFLTVHL
jgi:hypothetical protein